jgi:hypothetical protein
VEECKEASHPEVSDGQFVGHADCPRPDPKKTESLPTQELEKKNPVVKAGWFWLIPSLCLQKYSNLKIQEFQNFGKDKLEEQLAL